MMNNREKERNIEKLKKRSKDFAIRIIKIVRTLPNNQEGRTIGNQLIRCGTSQAANYRAACRARSRADFISKMGIVIEETDESLFWFELMVELGLTRKDLMTNIIQEGKELLAIYTSSVKTAKKNRNREGRKK